MDKDSIIKYISLERENEITVEYTKGIYVVRDCPIWIKLFHKDPIKCPPKSDGKWVLHNKPKHLESIAFDTLLPYVKKGDIEELKYRPALNHFEGPYAHLLPPMCIYAENKKKKGLLKQLTSLGLKDLYWVSNEETRERVRKLKENQKKQ